MKPLPLPNPDHAISASALRSRPSRSRPWMQIALLALALAFQSTAAAALDFRVDFRESTYTVDAGDTFSDLLAQHESETLIQSSITTTLEDISTSVYGGGARNDYSMLMTTTFDIGVAGFYQFQVGTDWGRGGAAALIDNNTGSILSERVIADNIWWSNDFNNSDVFTTSFNFSEGDSYSLVWLGFEDCCGGTSTIRFSVDSGDFAPLTESNIEPYTVIPEPSTALLIGLGLTGLAFNRERR